MRGTTAAIAAGLLVAGCGNLTENVAEEAAESAIESEGGGDVDVELDAGGDAATVELEGEDGAQRFTVGVVTHSTGDEAVNVSVIETVAG
jgi:hypothetical protein